MIYILLSTYNGALYLKEQLDSLLSQDQKFIKILIRDDGSKDNTIDIIESYKNRYDFISATYGNNIGVAASFLTLLDSVPSDAQYVSFCDQDDIWENDKLSRAISLISEGPKDSSLMYFSRATLVDQNNDLLALSIIPTNISFNNALVECVAAGCTMLFNQHAINLLRQNLPDPSKLVAHDAWCYLVISALGKIIYDTESKIRYRQHPHNYMGVNSGWVLFLKRIKRALRQKSALTLITKYIDQAKEFRKCFHNKLPKDKLETLEHFISCADAPSLLKKIHYIIYAPFKRQKKLDTLIFKYYLTLNTRKKSPSI